MTVFSSVVTTLALFLQSLEDPFLFITLITVLTLCLGLLKRSYAVSFFVTIALTFSITHISKSIFKVARPDDALVLAQGYRFPSMHAAIGAAILTSLAWYCYAYTSSTLVRCMLLFCAFFGIVFIGWTRIFLGVHEILDVYVGILLGASISLLFHSGMHFFKLNQ